MELGLRLWLMLTAVSAILATAGTFRKWRWLHLVFKPLTMVLITALALTRVLAAGGAYGVFILAGLFAGLAGDVLLMLSGALLRPGMAAFAVGNTLYLFAFASGPIRFSTAVLAAVLVFGAVMFFHLSPGLGAMRWPVVAYMAVLLAMVWLAACRRLALTGGKSLLALIGACLFLFSDSMNAVKRFKKPFRLAEVLILPPYFAAQLLLALSV